MDMVKGFVMSGSRILSTQLAPAGAVQVDRKLFSVQTNLHTNIILQSSKSGRLDGVHDGVALCTLGSLTGVYQLKLDYIV